MTDEAEMEFVVLHRVTLADHKVGVAVAPADLAGGPIPDGRLSYFPCPKSPPLAGCVYRGNVDVGEDGRITRLGIASAKFVRRVDGDHARVWRLADEAADADRRAESLEKRLRSTPALAGEVDALAALFRKLSYRERAAFPTAIMAAIHAAKGK